MRLLIFHLHNGGAIAVPVAPEGANAIFNEWSPAKAGILDVRSPGGEHWAKLPSQAVMALEMQEVTDEVAADYIGGTD